MPAQKPPTADERLESFHLWAQDDERDSPWPLAIVAVSSAVALILFLAYLARAAL
jgi:hypothetical protein